MDWEFEDGSQGRDLRFRETALTDRGRRIKFANTDVTPL